MTYGIQTELHAILDTELGEVASVLDTIAIGLLAVVYKLRANLVTALMNGTFRKQQERAANHRAKFILNTRARSALYAASMSLFGHVEARRPCTSAKQSRSP